MSSLTDTLTMVRNMIGPPEVIMHTLPFDRATLSALLQPHHLDFYEWHEKLMEWVETFAPYNPLRELCISVSWHLSKACSKIRILKTWAEGSIESLPVTDRHVVILALVDIQNAFEKFAVVSWYEKLKTSYMHDMVVKCLRTTSRIMLVLGRLLYPNRIDFLDRWEEVNEKSGMRDFKFDLCANEYRTIGDRTLSGAIVDAAETPETYLPSSRGPPVLVRNQGPYGSTILVNRRTCQKSASPQDVEHLSSLLLDNLLCIPFIMKVSLNDMELLEPRMPHGREQAEVWICLNLKPKIFVIIRFLICSFYPTAKELHLQHRFNFQTYINSPTHHHMPDVRFTEEGIFTISQQQFSMIQEPQQRSRHFFPQTEQTAFSQSTEKRRDKRNWCLSFCQKKVRERDRKSLNGRGSLAWS